MNLDLFKRLLVTIKDLTVKEESLMQFLNVDFCESKFLMNELNSLYDIGRDMLNIQKDSQDEDSYYWTVLDYILGKKELEVTLNEIKELI